MLLQERVDSLWLLRRVSCSHSCSAACVLPADVVGASDVVEQLNACLDDHWNSSFLKFTQQTAHPIVSINSTQVPAVSGSSWWNGKAQFGGWVHQLSGILSLCWHCYWGYLFLDSLPLYVAIPRTVHCHSTSVARVVFG